MTQRAKTHTEHCWQALLASTLAAAGPVKRAVVIDAAPSRETGRSNAAKWLLFEAERRGLDVAVPKIDRCGFDLRATVHEGDAALLILYGSIPECGSAWPAVPWEGWAQATAAMVESGAVVIVLAAGAIPAAIAACIRRGAMAVVPVERSDEMMQLLSADEAGPGSDLALLNGPPSTSTLIDHVHLLSTLTLIELRVLYYMVKGYPAGRIASVQQMSLSTVRAHIRSILRKLNVSSQLAAVAIANGTATPDVQEGPPDSEP